MKGKYFMILGILLIGIGFGISHGLPAFLISIGLGILFIGIAKSVI